MKKILLTTFTAGLLSLALITSASAAKGAKGADKAAKKAARAEKQKVLDTYDKNANGEIDGEEKDALIKAFATDTSLKSLDTNSDGKLDDAEIAAVKVHKKGEGKGAGKKKGKKKKNAAAA